MRRALFLDRDGVININHGYVHQIKNFDFIDGIFELAKAAHAGRYLLIVVTNQAGIARGYYTEQQFLELSEWMCEQFKMRGAPIAKVYYSPYHPTAGLGKYKKDDFTRKPKPGMILKARSELNIDIEKSILIGDSVSDIQAGIAAGVGCNVLFKEAVPSGELTPGSYLHVTRLIDAINTLTVNPERKVDK